MYCCGAALRKVDLWESDATKFVRTPRGILPPCIQCFRQDQLDVWANNPIITVMSKGALEFFREPLISYKQRCLGRGVHEKYALF